MVSFKPPTDREQQTEKTERTPAWRRTIVPVQNLLAWYSAQLKSSFSVQVASIIAFFTALTLITVAIILGVFAAGPPPRPGSSRVRPVDKIDGHVTPASQLPDPLAVLQDTVTTTLVVPSLLNRLPSARTAAIAVVVTAVVMAIITVVLLVVGSGQTDAMVDADDRPAPNIAWSPYYYLTAGLLLVAVGMSFFYGSQSLLRYRYYNELQGNIERSAEELKFALSEIRDELDPLEYTKLFNPGQFLDFYRFDGEPIGHGGWGIIYKVVEKATGEAYAVKRTGFRLSTHQTTEERPNERGEMVVVKTPDPGMEIRQTIREALLLYRLDHPNIIKVKEVFLVGLEAWTVMELAHKGSVGAHMKTHRRAHKDSPGFPEAVVAYVLRDALSALSYLHHRLIIHRDFKPGNLLLSEAGGVKLIDFGAAYQMSTPFDKPSDYIGTAHFLSPDFVAKRPYGRDLDIWALGITALAMAEGQVPRRELSNEETFQAILKDPIPQYNRDKYSALFNDFVDLCLKVDAGDRADARSLLSHPFLELACARDDFVKFFATETIL